MAVYKWTFIFGAQKAGWSESWYIETDSLSVARDNARLCGLKRMRLLGSGARLEAVRTSDVAIPGDAQIHRFTDEEVENNTVNYGTPTDTPWNAIYCRVEAGKDYRRPFHLRGVPDNVISFSESKQSWVSTDPTFAAEFGKFVDWMRKAPSVSIRAVSKNQTVAPLLKVDLVERVDATTVRITTTQPHGLFNFDYVRIRTLKFGGVNLGGRRRVFGIVPPNTFDIQLMVPAGTPQLVADKGTVRREVIAYPTITNIIVDRAAKKSTGRAFFSPVGRRRARK